MLLCRGRTRSPSRRSASATSARWRSSRTSSQATCSSTTRLPVEPPHIDFPEPVHELRRHAEGEGRRGEDGDRAPAPARGGSDPVHAARPADRRAAPLGPLADAGRGGGRPAQHAVPCRRRAPSAARSVQGDDPQGGARAAPLQEADGRARPVRRLRASCIEPLHGAEDGELGYEFVDKIVGGVISQSYRPAVDKGVREAMEHGELAGAPIEGVRVLLVDGMEHNVDSSEMAFKIAGSMAFKEAYQKADPVLLEPIMQLEVTVPDDTVGAVNGDLNSRRGRLQGMEPAGGMTTIKAEVPMAEILTYSQALTSMTGRPRRLLDALPPLRGSPDPRRAEDHRADEARARGGEGLVADDEQAPEDEEGSRAAGGRGDHGARGRAARSRSTTRRRRSGSSCARRRSPPPRSSPSRTSPTAATGHGRSRSSSTAARARRLPTCTWAPSDRSAIDFPADGTLPALPPQLVAERVLVARVRRSRLRRPGRHGLQPHRRARPEGRGGEEAGAGG